MIYEPSNGAFYSGLSGLVLPIAKYKYPEEFQHSSRLTYYSTFFNSIEINRSFYVLPNGKTISKWTREVPNEFKFTFKLWKQITHAKHLQFNEADVTAFMEAIDSAGIKKGCLLIQFPASLKSENIDELAHLLHLIQNLAKEHPWRPAIEFRDRSWYNDDTYDLVDRYNASVVLHDKSQTVSPHRESESTTIYIRFHGPKGDYRGAYSDEFLYEYAAYIRDWIERGKSVFVYFNNTMGDAFQNLRKLKEYVILSSA